MGRSITTKKFGILALIMNKLWPFKTFDLWGWGQNRWLSYGWLSFNNMDKFWKIAVVVAVAVESQEHRPLVLSGQDGGSNFSLPATDLSIHGKKNSYYYYYSN